MTDAIYDYEKLKDPLVDSARDYVERMDHYKQHQGKPITDSATTARRRREANGGSVS
jgi:hypothetical protein